ncbi:putative calcium-binding protein [Aphelenchoides besseyi]|nr:putative calcium-binding protein [Aphelenchoides besseyi]KAI6200997.1 putative calcium-binding protein [Aphelenchoides besseyi]
MLLIAASRMSTKKGQAVVTREEVEKAFEMCDSNGSGFIAIKRLKVDIFMCFLLSCVQIVMRAMGFEPRQKEVDDLIKKMQDNEAARTVSSDSFTLEELFHVLEDKMTTGEQDKEIRSAFELFDVKNKGYIDFQDLKRVAKELGEDEVKDSDLWEMIHIADFTKKGKVTENDFKLIMKKTKMY